MAGKRDHQALIDASRMYYVEGLDQGEIGSRLGLSRSTVSRMLATARDQGIIQVRIAGDDHVPRNRELEAQLIRSFGLREALVAQTPTSAAALKSVGKLAAELFSRRAPSAARIGFSWGFTVSQLAESISPVALRPDTKLIPLVGGMPSLDTAPNGNTILQLLGDKCGLTAERFDAPAIVESPATHHAMMQESTIRAAIRRAMTCDLAFVGIGTLGVHTSKKILEAMKLSDKELAQTMAADPVGDMAGRFFDINGMPLGLPTAERVIGVDLPALAGIDITVGLAAGKVKSRGVLGALRTGVLDVLVVDEALAASILALDSGRPSTARTIARTA